MEVYINEITLPGKDKFSNQFNYCSELYSKAQETDRKEDWDNYLREKLNLEQGWY